MDPDKGLSPINGHPAHMPTCQKHTRQARGITRAPAMLIGNMPPMRIIILCGTMDCIHRRIFFLHTNYIANKEIASIKT